jgi:hypothetical protein
MPKIIKYPNIMPGGNIPASGSQTTQRVPCFGAKAVLFMLRATGAGTHQTLTAPTYSAHPNATDVGWFAPVGITLFDGVNGRDPFNNGIVTALTPSNASSNMHYIMWPYAAINYNNGAGVAVQGCTVDAYVFYEGDSDKGQLGQDAAVPV